MSIELLNMGKKTIFKNTSSQKSQKIWQKNFVDIQFLCFEVQDKRKGIFMKKKAESCISYFFSLLAVCVGVNMVVINNNQLLANDQTIQVTEEKIQSVESGESIVISGDSELDSNLKMGAKGFIQNVFNGSFIKNVLTAREVVEQATEEYVAENIIIDEVVISGEELIETSDVIIDDEQAIVEEVVEEPVVEEIITNPGLPTVEINGEQVAYQRYVDIIRVNGKGGASAYCLCQKCCGKSPSSPGYGRTASGLVIVPGTGMKVLSVDPKVIPLGSKLYVQGLNGASDYGYAVAADTGGAIKGNRVDLYMDSHQDALKWGRRDVRVYILPD